MGSFIGHHREHDEALYVRKAFAVETLPVKAELKLSALGVVKGFCNGKEIDEDLLTPGWTNYHIRIPYYTFDITQQMRQGTNVIGFSLGHGWAVGKIAWFGKQHYSKQPMMWCSLQLTYADGTTECIESDESFRISFGQVLKNDLFDGEDWDSRQDLGAFSAIDYDDSLWLPATVYAGYTQRLEPAVAPLTKKKECLEGRFLHQQDYWHIYDCGKNHAGVPEVEITNAQAGTKLTILYGEMLNEDGSVYTTNLRSAAATDTYICREGRQVFAPCMTFHGYRYIGIRIDGDCQISAVRSRMIYSDIPFISTFRCSDEDINRLFQNVITSQKSNFINVPTDCPQRDERLGWTGDAQVFCLSAMFNADCRDFFWKFMVDVMDAQTKEGMIDSVAPTVAVDFDQKFGSPAWGDVITILPYAYYCVYKDPAIITLTLDAAKRWVRYCVDGSVDYVRPHAGYGDWLSMNETTDNDLLGSFYMAYSTLLVSRMCEIVKDEAYPAYYALYEDMRRTIRRKYMTPEGKLSSDTQTAYCLAYVFGLMSADEVRPHLVACLHRHNNHLSTGFVGVKYLLPVLCEIGEIDLAYEVFTQKDCPSWCYPVINGATSIWERWDSYVMGKGFSNPGMNSFNHYSFGAVCEWMFDMLLGIHYTQNEVIIRPRIDTSGRITWAEGSTICNGKRIGVYWKNLDDGWTELKLQNPENVRLDLGEYAQIKHIEEGTYWIRR